MGNSPRLLSAFVYKPATPGPHPVLINIHGGPESQYRPRWDAFTQYLVNELGYAVVAPNVRGSSGYGRSFLKLDDGALREDAVRDIGSLLVWIGLQPDLDRSRVVVMGGSYGGYMSLASMVNYGDRLPAASTWWASATSSVSSPTPPATAATCAAWNTATSATRTCGCSCRASRR